MEGTHLASSYRPQRFSQLIGQEHIKRSLSLSAGQGCIAPAYLFSGTRGVGKTSVARIFAKAINCRSAPCEEPCNRCDICEEITRGVSLDVLEIDGASHTGVDHVRKLIEDISLSPVKCRYRVVIIDEVHMLSRSAFNALLKTLEEPPAHVVFILATTEPHKIPDTIISRCQHFVFRRLGIAEVSSLLAEILQREGVSFEKDALELIARRGGGSVRDSLSMLSQVLALGREGIDSKLVREMLGLAPSEAKFELVQAIASRDVNRVIEEIEALLAGGIDILYFLQEMSMVWRDMFLVKMGGKVEDERISLLAEKFPISHIHGAWQMLVHAQSRLERQQDPALFLELLFMNITFFPYLTQVGEVSSPPVGDKKRPSLRQKGVERGFGLKRKERGWREFIDFLKKENKLSLFPHIEKKMVRGKREGDRIVIECPLVWAERLRGNEARFAIFKEEIKKFWGEEVEVVFSTPSSHEGQVSLRDKALSHPAVKRIMDEFDAKVVGVYPRNSQHKGV